MHGAISLKHTITAWDICQGLSEFSGNDVAIKKAESGHLNT